VFLTALPAVWRQFFFVGEIHHLARVGSDHQAHNVIGALLIETVFIVENQPFSVASIASVAQEPALRRLDKHAMRHLRSCLEQSQDGEIVGRVLLAPQDRYTQFLHGGMAQLVEQHKEHVAHYEFH